MAWSTTINTSQTTNPSNNTSTVYASLTFSAINQGYSNYTTTFNIYIGGNLVANDVGPRALNTDGSGTDTWTSATYSYTFTHDANGARGTVATSGTFYGQGGFSPPSSGVGGTGTTFGALNYDRIPNTPTTPSFVSRNRESISMSTSATLPGGSPSAPSITSYTWQVSTDAISWNTISGQSGSTLNYTAPSATTQYYFKALATNSEGSSAYSSPSAIVAAAPSQPASPTLERNGLDVSVGLTAPATNGSTLTSFSLDYSTSSSFTAPPTGDTITIGSIIGSSQAVEDLTPGTTYYFRYKVGSNRGDSLYSPISNISIPAIPAAPSIPSALTKQVRKVTIDWNVPSGTGFTISGYEVQARYSSDNGSTWDTSFENLGTTNSSTTIFVTSDLNIAKLYQFRVRALTDIGNSDYSDTSSVTEFNSVFISAYGYRHDGTNFDTAIQFAARYTGNSEDSINVGGTVYSGWKTIENVKRYDGSDFISLTQ